MYESPQNFYIKMKESTPNIPALNLGKLKSEHLLHSNAPSPIIPIHSSTLNDSLISGVELWNLKITPNLTPSTSTTTSPTEFYKNHQESLQKTPLKTASCSKLGSPERNLIISGRKPNLHVITPKIDRSSPAKKRLFGVHNISSKTPLTVHRKHDPVHYFMKKQNVPLVVEQIFGELGGRDLYNCRKVSHTWKEAVDVFPAFNKSALEFSQQIAVNKENPSILNKLLENDQSGNDVSGLFEDKFIQLGLTLKENQRLTKCLHCENPQIIEHNIGQCLSCGYICCFKCNSFSHDGPEHFVDKCQRVVLEIPKSFKRRTLMDSPPHSQLSFLSSSNIEHDNSYLYTNDNTNTSKDSCYWSYEDAKSTSLLNQSNPLRMNNGQRSAKRHCLDDSNCSKRQTTNKYTPVVVVRKSPEKKTTLEDTPEKDLTKFKGVGTVASKKRLRRLLR